ncbi:MAG: hypothetical protein PHQ11_16500 [Paludibacter sp.]|nr:hypothetical protein [Paludibacter sp.]
MLEMVRGKDVKKFRNDVNRLKRQLKIAQNRLFRSWDIARTTTFDINTFAILEQKERHFRAMKRRLTGMEESLRALQEGSPETAKVKPWKITRPSTESRLFAFVEV